MYVHAIAIDEKHMNLKKSSSVYTWGLGGRKIKDKLYLKHNNKDRKVCKNDYRVIR